MNRRQRRAANKTNSSPSAELKSADDIPLARPPSTPSSNNTGSSSKTKAKTLYEIAAERQKELLGKGQPFSRAETLSAQSQEQGRGTSNDAAAFVTPPKGTRLVTLNADGSISEMSKGGSGGSKSKANRYRGSRAKDEVNKDEAEVEDEEESDASMVALFDTIFLALPLSCIHFTLSVLAAHQYAQSLSIPPLFINTLLVAFPLLAFLIHLSHGHMIPAGIRERLQQSPSTSWIVQWIKTAVFVIVANVSGCYLISVTNDKGYYAVMKKAPSIGTIWVWSVLELGLGGALAGVAGPAGYAWWYGYGIY